MWLEGLEARIAPAITTTLLGQPSQPWAFEGPSSIGVGFDGEAPFSGTLAPTDFVIGAVNAVAIHPTNPDIAYAAAVNGGIWRTDTFTDPLPFWRQFSPAQSSPGQSPFQVDQLRSLSIKTLAIDPVDPNIIYAGVKNSSSFGLTGTSSGQIYRSRDGGQTWESLRRPDTLNGLPFEYGDEANRIRVVREAGPGGDYGALYVASRAGMRKFGKDASGHFVWTSLPIPGLAANATVMDFAVVPRVGGGSWLYAAAVATTLPDAPQNIRMFNVRVFVAELTPGAVTWVTTPVATHNSVNTVILTARETLSNPAAGGEPVYSLAYNAARNLSAISVSLHNGTAHESRAVTLPTEQPNPGGRRTSATSAPPSIRPTRPCFSSRGTAAPSSV